MYELAEQASLDMELYMADEKLQGGAPAQLEDEGNSVANGSGIVIWTISADHTEIIPDPAFKPPVVKVIRSTSSANQSSTGGFELADEPSHLGQREDPGSVRGRIAYSVLMVLVGVVLIGVGIVTEVKSVVPGGGVPFWVIGVLLLIPGVYCVWDSIGTYRQMQLTDRQHIFKEDQDSS